MDIEQEPPTSLVKKLARWLADFDRAMEMRPVDYLELRVVELERRVGSDRQSSPSIPVRSANVRSF